MACNGDLFPRLFWTQSATNVDIPTAAAGTTPVLTLEPIVTLSEDEVKLDSMVELQIASGVTPLSITGVSYVLQRSTNGGAFTALAQLDVDATTVATTTITLYPNLTWVDRPGVGTHIYRIVITTNAALIGNTITAETRALNALVVREA